ncbi:MAG: hypothetical protein KDD45_16780, partial [Bdellovibrionales bacterium]|nr:hypothetical protein [Bdellovibrionales bacterium]
DVQKYKGAHLSLVGICTAAQERMTKKNTPFGILQVEDYSNSHEFFIFGEDYIKFRPYFVAGQFLFIQGSIQPRKWSKDPNDVEFRINSIELLSELREKKAKGITLTIDSNDVSDKLINEITEIINNHAGKYTLGFNLKDEKEGIIGLQVRTKKVELSNEFIRNLEEIKEIDYKIV